MLNICDEFGNKWDIRFNLAKTQCVTFGGNSPKAFTPATGAKRLSCMVHKAEIFRVQLYGWFL